VALYEYLCSTCQGKFELIRPMSEADETAECPGCGSKARRIISSWGTRTEDSSQVTRKPSRNASAARTPTGKAKTAKTAKKRTASKAVAVLERGSGWHGDPSADIFKEELDLWRSTSGTTVHITAVLDEGTAVGSEVDFRQAATPIEMSWLAEYQPSGSNLWFIHDWGIASILGYLRDRWETESTERRPYPAETMGTEMAEADGHQHRVVDQQMVISVEPDAAARPTEPTGGQQYPAETVESELAEADGHQHRVVDQQAAVSVETEVAARPEESADLHSTTSEQRSVLSVRPWREETAMESAEADRNYTDLASQQIESHVVERSPDEAITDLVQAAALRSQPAEEQSADLARRSRLTEGRTDGEFPEQVVRAAWRRQGGRCARCGRWLIWPHRDRDSGTGAWQSHRRIPEDQGGRTTLANCVLFCSGVGNCHFNVGHGGIAWSHYAPLDESALLFLFDISTTVTEPGAPTRPKRSLLKAVLGISQSK
jgi:putative FmdB family regulatory protein